jgi:putative exosortase-associated protein (TIGR04073 family)
MTTPSPRTLLAAGLALLLAGAPCSAAADDHVPAPLAKLTRGITNLALGLPGEIAYNVVETAHSDEGLASAGGHVAGLFSGLLMGIGMGAARMGSGLVDVVTFPIPFDDNRPIVEPDYII